MPVPSNPHVYHIVHFDRLPSIVADGKLLSDYVMSQRSDQTGTTIGMSKIKTRRLSLPVGSPPQGKVGQYVPFYFCPRSVMLYIMHKSDHVDIAYRGGQKPIVHLVADFDKVTAWAQKNDRKWAFTSSNAGAVYTEFYFTKGELSKLNWDAIAANDFRQRDIQEAKQSEFLMETDFPWELINEIGVLDQQMKSTVEQIISTNKHKPPVNIRKEWYYL